jgi:transcription initiation factor TFIID subunit 8
LPDPHAYIRTATYKQPVTEYEAIREKAANQKRDIEKALTKFLAKTSETHSLFDDEENQMFPLIACKPQFPTYMAALNPTDQIFDFEELEYYYQVANRKEDPVAKEEEDNEENEDGIVKEEKPEDSKNLQSENPESSTNNGVPQIDNPYLRTATVPRKKLKSE